MATFTFDGTSSITASKTDTVLINADPTTFTQATDNGSSVTLAFGAQTITITGTTLAANNLPNVFVTGGTFSYADTVNSNGSGTGNVLSFLNTANNPAFTTTAASKVAIFGGLGVNDSIDGNDTINIGGKGTFLVHGNGGDDRILQSATAFDSTSTVNVFADQGSDTITLGAANAKASIFAGGGAGTDSITVVNSGTTTIFGGVDSTDGADTITFNGVANAAGTSQIFGNGGSDSITVGGTSALDSTSTTTVYGGVGDDTIAASAVTNAKATISILGGEGADTITVTNSGNTYITGGLQSGDQSADSADNITFTGGGTSYIFGNAGADTINAAIGNTSDTTSTANIYGGKDNDIITQTIAGGATSKASVFIAGGEGTDSITAIGNGGAVTIYGGISSTDSTDGADTITLSANSTGTVNIFANGGADSVSIGALGTDTTNTVTVYGGGGNDTISVAIQTDGKQALVLNGNDGADTFTIAKGTGQTVTIADFTVSADKLAITGAAAGSLAVVGGTYQTLQNALDAAANAAGTVNKAAAVVFGGSTYVVVSDGNAGFQTAADQAIKLTGVTDLVGLTGATTITA